MKRILNILISTWANISDKIGLTDTKTDQIIITEVVRRQNLLIRQINTCTTWDKLQECKRSIQLYIDASFDIKYTRVPISILNSWIGWKELEFKRFEHINKKP